MTKDEDELVRKLFSDGMSKKDIQKKMKVGRTAILSSLARTANKHKKEEENEKES